MDHGLFYESRDGGRSWRWGGEGLPNWGGSRDLAISGDVLYMTLGQPDAFDGTARPPGNTKFTGWFSFW